MSRRKSSRRRKGGRPVEEVAPAPAPPAPRSKHMTDAHRTVLQFLLSKGFVKLDAMEQFWQQLCEMRGDDEEGEMPPLNDVRLTINDSLHFMLFEVRQTQYELDGQMYWVLVNKAGDDTATVASEFTQDEVVYYRRLIAHMADHEGVIGTEAAHRMALAPRNREHKKLTDAVCTALLHALVAKGWLAWAGGRERLTFGPRVEPELREFWNEIEGETCCLCHGKVIFGLVCLDITADEDHDCNARAHLACMQRVVKRHQERGEGAAPIQCPKCKREWLVLGGKKRKARSSRTSRSSSSSSSSSRFKGEDDYEEDGMEEGEEEGEGEEGQENVDPSNTPAKRKRQSVKGEPSSEPGARRRSSRR